jgi:hypothetical protein
MRTATRELTVATSPHHQRSVHADEAAGAGHQHRHGRRAVRVTGALARFLRPLRVKRHVRPLQKRPACLATTDAQDLQETGPPRVNRRQWWRRWQLQRLCQG